MPCSFCKLLLVAVLLSPMSALAQGGGGGGLEVVVGRSRWRICRRCVFERRGGRRSLITGGRARRRFGRSEFGARRTCTA